MMLIIIIIINIIIICKYSKNNWYYKIDVLIKNIIYFSISRICFICHYIRCVSFHLSHYKYSKNNWY